MIINTTILKEKSVLINQFLPAPKMQIKMNRINIMPEKSEKNVIQCEIKFSILIVDENDKNLANLTLGYIVIATLEQDDTYEKDDFADKLFKILKPMYISEANNLLRGSPFPPIPMNIKC